MSSDFSDIELIDRLLRGEPGAFEGFYKRYNRLIYHCIRRRAHAPDVDDIFQRFFEFLVKTDYRALRLWQRRSKLSLYLSIVVKNFVVSALRKKPRRETPEGGLSDLERYEPAEEETLTTAIILRQLRGVGLQAWAKLAWRDKRLICWKFHRGVTNEVMAERLNLTNGAQRKALFDAVKKWLIILERLAPEYFSR